MVAPGHSDANRTSTNSTSDRTGRGAMMQAQWAPQGQGPDNPITLSLTYGILGDEASPHPALAAVSARVEHLGDPQVLAMASVVILANGVEKARRPWGGPNEGAPAAAVVDLELEDLADEHIRAAAPGLRRQSRLKASRRAAGTTRRTFATTSDQEESQQSLFRTAPR